MGVVAGRAEISTRGTNVSYGLTAISPETFESVRAFKAVPPSVTLKRLNDLRIAEVHNIGFTTTPVHPLAGILRENCKIFIYLQHQIRGGTPPSKVEIYIDRSLSRSRHMLGHTTSLVLSYILTVPRTLWLFLSLSTHLDYYIAGDELNTVTGLLLKKLGRVQSVIFYSIDYFPKRFKNRLLDGAFKWIEKIAVKSADAVWVVSPMMANIRRTQGAKRVIRAPGMGSTITVSSDNSTRKDDQLVYVGLLSAEKGLDLAIRSLPKLIQKFPDLQLVVAGDGPYRQQLEEVTRVLHLEQVVVFKGIQSRSDLNTTLMESSIGIATYVPEKFPYALYSFPGKVVEYLSKGLPVIMTRVPSIWNEIETGEAGICINYKESDFISAVETLLQDQSRMSHYRERALSIATGYQFEELIVRTIVETLQLSDTDTYPNLH
jgi:glycosyltransferase involved in cell wall biosynthesis